MSRMPRMNGLGVAVLVGLLASIRVSAQEDPLRRAEQNTTRATAVRGVAPKLTATQAVAPRPSVSEGSKPSAVAATLKGGRPGESGGRTASSPAFAGGLLVPTRLLRASGDDAKGGQASVDQKHDQEVETPVTKGWWKSVEVCRFRSKRWGEAKTHLNGISLDYTIQAFNDKHGVPEKGGVKIQAAWIETPKGDRTYFELDRAAGGNTESTEYPGMTDAYFSEPDGSRVVHEEVKTTRPPPDYPAGTEVVVKYVMTCKEGHTATEEFRIPLKVGAPFQSK